LIFTSTVYHQYRRVNIRLTEEEMRQVERIGGHSAAKRLFMEALMGDKNYRRPSKYRGILNAISRLLYGFWSH